MEEVKIKLSSDILFEVFHWPITNSMMATWLVMILLLIAGYIYKKKIFSKFNIAIDWALESLFSLVDGVTQDRKITNKIFPWIATFFIFILFNNWIELIPGFSAIGAINHEHHHVEVLKAANTDLNTTLALAIISVVATQILGILGIGFFKHAKKYLNFSGIVDFFIGLLEIVSELSRIMSFAFRLFGNIFAGEVLLIVIAFMVPYIIPIPFYGLEIFVGFIQALVFSMLTMVFMTMAHKAH